MDLFRGAAEQAIEEAVKKTEHTVTSMMAQTDDDDDGKVQFPEISS